MISEKDHETQDLYYSPLEGKKYKVPIDVRLAPLIRLVWRAGIHTRACCQGDVPSYYDHTKQWKAYILFERSEDLIKFMEIFYKDKYFPTEIAPHVGACSQTDELVTFNISHCNNLNWESRIMQSGVRPCINFEPRFIESLTGVFSRYLSQKTS